MKDLFYTLFVLFLFSFLFTSGQTNSIVTEYYLANNFSAKSGITPGTNNTVGMDCDQILARYNVSISGITTTGNRLPSQNQLTSGVVVCPNIGDMYEGGIVAYIFKPEDPGYVEGECHGIICTVSDQTRATKWSENYTSVFTSASIGSGESNTNSIIASQGSGTYAARFCYDLTEGGYNDWVLPSANELYEILINRDVIGGFEEDDESEYNMGEYWSSTEHETYDNTAYYLHIEPLWGISIGNIPKLNTTLNVRAIRYF